jgi:hypothetical protein
MGITALSGFAVKTIRMSEKIFRSRANQALGILQAFCAQGEFRELPQRWFNA